MFPEIKKGEGNPRITIDVSQWQPRQITAAKILATQNGWPWSHLGAQDTQRFFILFSDQTSEERFTQKVNDFSLPTPTPPDIIKPPNNLRKISQRLFHRRQNPD